MSNKISNDRLRKGLREGTITRDGMRLVSRRWSAAETRAAERERELMQTLHLARDFLYYSETPSLCNRIDALLKHKEQSNV